MVHRELRRRQLVVNAKRVRRLMHEENLVIQVRRFAKTSEYRPDHGDWPNLLKNQEITRLNQAWAADITYIDLGREFVYLAVILDVCSRAIRGWHLDRDLSSALTHRALDRALAKHGPPQTLKEEEVYLTEYEGLADARRRIRRFLEDVYMRKRMHSALDYRTPAEFEAELSKQKK